MRVRQRVARVYLRLPVLVFNSQAAYLGYWIWYILSFYFTVLFVFIFCYGSILVAIRRQAHVMAAHSSAGSSTAQTQQSKKIKTNVIKTMILVSVLFAVAWVPP